MDVNLVRGIVHAGKCVPSNTTLSGPLAQPLTDLIGAANGLMPYIITAVAVILAIAAIIAIKSDRVAKWIKAILWVLLIPIALWFGLMVYFVITGALVNVPACPF